MYSVRPIGSKLLEDKWNKMNMERHQERLKLIKPTIKTYIDKPIKPHVPYNSKRAQLFSGITLRKLDRCIEIQRENKILLEKMAEIMNFNRPTTVCSAYSTPCYYITYL